MSDEPYSWVTPDYYDGVPQVDDAEDEDAEVTHDGLDPDEVVEPSHQIMTVLPASERDDVPGGGYH